MAIELVPLCTLQVRLKPPVDVGAGCAGTRVIVEVASVQVKGIACALRWREPQPRIGCSSVLRARERVTSGRRFAPMTARDDAGQRRDGPDRPWANPDTSDFIAFCNANDCVFAFTDAESAVLSATVADAHGSSTSLTAAGSWTYP